MPDSAPLCQGAGMATHVLKHYTASLPHLSVWSSGIRLAIITDSHSTLIAATQLRKTLFSTSDVMDSAKPAIKRRPVLQERSVNEP
ncbi:hypothetical protein E2C01_007233 [Portunus trituberculatus]|uniref:Uncharacterized protein n=1 Tax=Portunus trituberculatus TaxID=210409 RepID=A0A5B7D1V4_PORTR|nr:hypothetical protein [Portunus trituberculatus]